ncbi:embryonal Fyn-associated substrate-like, partial [Cetorhinus maximus]
EAQPADGANVYEGVGPSGQECDYVRLQGKQDVDGCRGERSSAGETTESVGQLERKQQSGADQDPARDPLAATDRRLVAFYSQQCSAHLSTLLGAIDGLFACLRGGGGGAQPPRVFVGHGRHVIVSAHKLVFIGDALSRQARVAEVRSRVGRSGALLCQALKRTVHATKAAALRYPELDAVQDMVDQVAELSHHALRFTQLLADLTPSATP